ncbi:hypothetical protein NEMBOFW57_003949 [Staphylotrichum longicolle]|uniref:Uncharacterized protein n=1 Tax=Staphylotrichum longicolle TaxID=669026 RepID=A0AAD4F710_9PEZI|nr:hypothetical protein NEMBOFW57_003949 [Staphylotrichum longicolle]
MDCIARMDVGVPRARRKQQSYLPEKTKIHSVRTINDNFDALWKSRPEEFSRIVFNDGEHGVMTACHPRPAASFVQEGVNTLAKLQFVMRGDVHETGNLVGKLTGFMPWGEITYKESGDVKMLDWKQVLSDMEAYAKKFRDRSVVVENHKAIFYKSEKKLEGGKR